jgi:drug/metabolite transporter (DMT)-like permease
MVYLLIVSLIWAFSFGLIKTNLTGIDPALVSTIRLAIALLVFLPFLRLKNVSKKLALQLLLIGALEFGLMYIFYNFSFQSLKAYEVALFTIFTPFYVALLHNLIQKRWNTVYVLTAILAVAGTAVIKYADITRPGLLLGFSFVQGSNICFAIGQVLYRKTMLQHPEVKDRDIFAVLYTGGALIALAIALVLVKWNEVNITSTQWWNLAYLGALASGFGFFLWNYGARRTNAGALAVFNNLKVPLSITVSLLFFHEKTNLTSLLIGGLVILLALLINQVYEKRVTARVEPNSSNSVL